MWTLENFSYVILFIESWILFLTNLMALIVIFSSKKLRERFNEKLILMLFNFHSLAAVFNITAIAHMWGGYTYRVRKQIWFIRDIFISLEVNITILLSIERFVAIRKPFWYATLNKQHAV